MIELLLTIALQTTTHHIQSLTWYRDSSILYVENNVSFVCRAVSFEWDAAGAKAATAICEADEIFKSSFQ